MHKYFKRWSNDLIPVNIQDKGNGKKDVRFSPWKDGEVYTTLSKNSIALRTGKLTANVIDIDTKDLDSLPEPFRSWVDERLMFDDTLIVESRRGFHFYFSSPDFLVRTSSNIDRKGNVLKNIDFRGEGGVIFIDSTSDIANYKVICDNELTTDISDIIDHIPNFTMTPKTEANEELGFNNLDDEDDTDVVVVPTGTRKTLEEVKAMLALLSADVPRDTWIMYLASAYNLVDNTTDEFKEMLRAWSKDTAGEHEFEDSSFEHAWDEISSGRFGKAYKGGALVKEAVNKGYIDPTLKNLEKAQQAKFQRYTNAIQECVKVEDIKALFIGDASDWKQEPLCTEAQQKGMPNICKTRATQLYKDEGVSTKATVDEFKPLILLEKKKGKVKAIEGLQTYFYDNTWHIAKDNHFAQHVRSGGLQVYASAWNYDVTDFVAQAQFKSIVIQGVKQETDYLSESEVSYELRSSKNPSELPYLHVLTNPLHDIQEIGTRTDIINDFFEEVWNGKAEEIIKLIGLSMRFKETKLNKIHIVAPSNVGKTTFLANIGFQEITMKRLLPAMNAEKGIGKSVIDNLKGSGFLLIDEANKPLTEDIKNIDNYIYLDQFGQGGTQEIKLHYTCLTSTHNTAVRGMSDEMYNRLLLVRLPEAEVGHLLTAGELFINETEVYTNTITQHSKWLLKDSLTNPIYTKNDLRELQAKYRLELNDDVSEMLTEISEHIVTEFKTLSQHGTDVIERDGEYLIKRKKEITQAIEDRLSEYSHIDSGKYGDNLASHFLTERRVSIRVNGTVQKFYVLNLKKYYLDKPSDEELVVDEFDDLDIEEL